MAITKGKHTYIGIGPATERFDPVVEIGSFTSIGAGTCFYGTCEHPQTISTFPFGDLGWSDIYPKTFSKGKIVIGSDVWIGEDVKIMDGVNIGHGAIVGAGAVVAKNVPPYARVVGNPIKIIDFRFRPEQIEELLRLKWWEKDDEEIKALLPLMADKKRFMEGFV